jgi:hypothetical protein
MCSTIHVTGTVRKGRGHAAQVMQAHAFYKKVLGDTLRAGSINFLAPVVGPQYHFIPQQSIYPQDIQRNGWLRFCPCRLLGGHEAFIVSCWHPCHTWDTGTTVEHRDKTLFEIMGPEIPGVVYGATFALEYDPSQARQASIV